jgi:uncharacterized protein (TIGR02117 family)
VVPARLRDIGFLAALALAPVTLRSAPFVRWFRIRRVAIACVLFCGAGCSQLPWAGSRAKSSGRSEMQLPAYSDEPQQRTLYVTSNGFHSGLLLRKEDVPRDAWPEVDAIPDHPWIEVGWGSEIFYRAKKITAPVVMRAFLPNPSALHVVGWDAAPEEMVTDGDLIRLQIDEAQFANLCRYIHTSYVLDEQEHPQDLGPGNYGDSKFFRARGRYYFPKTCNVWTAKGLRAAGLPIVPELCGAADPLLIAVRGTGVTIRRR